MNTPLQASDTPAKATPQRTRRWAFAGVAAVAIVAVGIGALALTSDDDEQRTATSVAYSFGEAVDPTMGMCLPVTDYVPSTDVVGFKGVVTAVSDTSVTVEVSKWFAGGDADIVQLDTTGVGIPALDGVEFAVGGEYLVAVLDGQVLICGISGPADPVLEGLYERWFG